MRKIKESVEIEAPPERVFAFMTNIQARLKLNPFYSLLDFQELSQGEVRVGSRFRITLSDGKNLTEYESVVAELVPHRRIATRDTEDRVHVVLTLARTAKGTLLTHEEEFVIPADLLYPAEQRVEMPFWMKVVKGFFAIEQASFTGGEAERRAGTIVNGLRKNLKVWLLKIKETLEAEAGRS